MMIDLNADLGEGGANDSALLQLVSSANIACGFHAGDAGLMVQSVREALKYGVAVGAHPGYPDRENFGRTAGIFNEAILKVQYAMNTVCIKCFSGMANAACAAIDSMDWDGVVGTIAGDDTIFVLCRSEREAQIFTVNLEKMLHA